MLYDLYERKQTKFSKVNLIKRADAEKTRQIFKITFDLKVTKGKQNKK